MVEIENFMVQDIRVIESHFQWYKLPNLTES